LIREGIDPKKTFFPDEEDDWLKVSPPHLASPYGLLRSPWNFNPSKYTTRYNKVNRIADTDDSIDNTKWGLYLGSTCKDYASFITHVKSKNSQFTSLELKMTFTAISTLRLEALVVITALRLMIYYELITNLLT